MKMGTSSAWRLLHADVHARPTVPILFDRRTPQDFQHPLLHVQAVRTSLLSRYEPTPLTDTNSDGLLGRKMLTEKVPAAAAVGLHGAVNVWRSCGGSGGVQHHYRKKQQLLQKTCLDGLAGVVAVAAGRAMRMFGKTQG